MPRLDHAIHATRAEISQQRKPNLCFMGVLLRPQRWVELTSDQLSARLIFERGEMASLTTLYEVEVVVTADSYAYALVRRRAGG